MVKRSRLVTLSLLALFLVACDVVAVSTPSIPAVPAPSETPTATVGVATPTETPTATIPPVTPTATPAATVPTATPTETPIPESPTPPQGPCELVAESEVTVYERPSTDAAVFGSMPSWFRILAEARTADGWLGFEPGVAQAANVGVFRLRWVDGSSSVHLEGACEDLPELVGPPAGVCFTMPTDDVQVYAEPAAFSTIVTTMTYGDYAAVTGKTTDDWARVDLSVGNTGLGLIGWTQGFTLNLNGPCDALPTVEP
jgi:hypothetical protein